MKLCIFYFLARYPKWIPYTIMTATGISLPLVFLVKEQYNRSALDSLDNETPENEEISENNDNTEENHVSPIGSPNLSSYHSRVTG